MSDSAIAALKSQVRAIAPNKGHFTLPLADMPKGIVNFHVAVCVQGTPLCDRQIKNIIVGGQGTDTLVEFEGVPH